MGSVTDARIAAWQARAGITPATGKRAEVLHRIQAEAFEQIKMIEPELSGIRDGDGGWHGCNPIDETLAELGKLAVDPRRYTD